MYIETVKRKTKKKTYEYILLRRSYRDPVTKKPTHETLLNLTKWPKEKVAALKAIISGDKLIDAPKISTEQGKDIGGIWVFNEIAKQIGLRKALGNDRRGKIALLLILGRILTQGSRHHLLEWIKGQEIDAVLGIKDLKKDELYTTLDWLAGAQSKIEDRLYRAKKKRSDAEKEGSDTGVHLYLYDVTSSYLEGEKNDLACYGYNRDKKKGKKQIVIGLLTDSKGRPVSVCVFDGNRSDTTTVEAQIQTISTRFKAKKVIMVGDRGMIKSPQKTALNAFDFNYITAITRQQIANLI